MSDPAPPDHAERTLDGGRPLTPQAIDRVLADFRNWLQDLTTLPPAAPVAEPFSVHALVVQFTALRHEVNMQTKAARSAVEQTSAAIQLLQPAEEPEADDDQEQFRPFVKMLLDVHDALSVAHRQMERAKVSADEFANVPTPPPPAAGFFARLLGSPTDLAAWRNHVEQLTAHNQKLRQQFAAVADGYAMSLRRVERSFPDLGLEPLAEAGEPFDPETMEVVNAEAAAAPAGTVLEVVRQGYVWNDALFRHAQVKVAK
jgi:molecular chaperone GrpE